MVKTLFITLFLFLGVVGAAWACPSCKDALSGQDPASVQLTQGYARSIALMMGAPYVLFAALTFHIVRTARKKNTAGL